MPFCTPGLAAILSSHASRCGYFVISTPAQKAEAYIRLSMTCTYFAGLRITYDPTIVCNIGDSAFVSYQIAGRGGFQMVIKHLVQAASLILIAIDAILDMFWCISSEMVSLTLHRSDSCIEEEELQTNLGQLYSQRQNLRKATHTQLFIS